MLLAEGLYLGKTYDPDTRTLGEEFRLRPSDLTTHGIVIGMTGSGKTGLSIVRSSPHMRDIQVENSTCVVELETDDAGVQQLLHQLMAHNIGVRSFADKDPSLEDVFMLVTKGLVA